MNRPTPDDEAHHPDSRSPERDAAHAAETSASTVPFPNQPPREEMILESTLEEAESTKDTGVEAGEAETPSPQAHPATVAGAPQERHTVARSAGIVSLAVMGSRVLGLVREQVFAAKFGAGFVYDAFQVGFLIPNTMRDLFAEGALSVAFVKTFTDYIVNKTEIEAWRLASLVMNALAIVLSVITILGIIFSPQIVAVVAVGFSPEKAALATTLTRIMFPFLLLVALAAVAMGVLNAKGRFGIPASASTLFNVGSIIGGLALAYWLSGGNWTIGEGGVNVVPDEATQWAIIGMAIGTLIGGALQFLIQVPSLWRVGFRFRPLVSFTDPGVRQVMRLMGPAIIGTAAVQINVLINTMFASGINGGRSWLSYSFRLMQFPIGIFGVAIATATIPAISRFAARQDMQNFRSTLSSSIGLVFLLTIPSACGLIVLGQPIIALIYQRGEFTATDTQMVATALAGYAIGLAGYAAIKVLSPAFYALDDARTPMLISLFSIAVNAVASYFFRTLFSTFHVTPETPNGYGHVGLALSTSCVALVNFVALAFLLRRRIKRLEGRRILSSFLRIALASIALSVACYGAYRWLFSLTGGAGLMARLIETFIPMMAGGLVFFFVARLLRIAELDQAVQAIGGRFRRRRPQPVDAP